MTIERLHTIEVPSPLHELRLVASERGLRALLWYRHEEHRVPFVGAELVQGSSEVLDLAARQLDEYFAGAREEFDLPLDPVGTPFQLQAWAVLRTIPFGQT